MVEGYEKEKKVETIANHRITRTSSDFLLASDESAPAENGLTDWLADRSSDNFLREKDEWIFSALFRSLCFFLLLSSPDHPNNR